MPLNARQETISAWLRKAYPNAADLFLSGLRVRDDAETPCRMSLMAHALREVCIAINNVHSSNSRNLEPAVNAMVREYRRHNYEPPPLPTIDANAVPVPDDGSIEVSGAFIRTVADVVAAHESQRSGRERTRIALNAIASASGVQVDATPTADRWQSMYNKFVACAHGKKLEEGGADMAAFDLEVQFFEETLESLAQPAIANLDDLDVILESANA